MFGRLPVVRLQLAWDDDGTQRESLRKLRRDVLRICLGSNSTMQYGDYDLTMEQSDKVYCGRDL